MKKFSPDPQLGRRGKDLPSYKAPEKLRSYKNKARKKESEPSIDGPIILGLWLCKS